MTGRVPRWRLGHTCIRVVAHIPLGDRLGTRLSPLDLLSCRAPARPYRAFQTLSPSSQSPCSHSCPKRPRCPSAGHRRSHCHGRASPRPGASCRGDQWAAAQRGGGTMVATVLVALVLLCLPAGTEASPELGGEWHTGDHEGWGTSEVWGLGGSCGVHGFGARQGQDPLGDVLGTAPCPPSLPQHPERCPRARRGGCDFIWAEPTARPQRRGPSQRQARIITRKI